MSKTYQHLHPGPFTEEERAFLLQAVEIKLKDINEGRPMAALHIEDFAVDPFWRFYADMLLGGADQLVRRLKVLTKSAGPRRLIPRNMRRGRDRVR